jgi:DNA polymerase-3 subunit chi
MTQVAFHLDAPDKAAYTCRLLRKAVSVGTRVLVTGDGRELEHLDSALWCFAPREFVPHCRTDAPAQVLSRSAIVLASPVIPDVMNMTALVHLGGAMAVDMGRFEKVIEVVGQGEQDRAEARARWKQYAAQGHELTHHDASQIGRRHD